LLDAEDPSKKDTEGKFKDLRTKCKGINPRINKIRFTPDSMYLACIDE